jgi:hypothetical protein
MKTESNTLNDLVKFIFDKYDIQINEIQDDEGGDWKDITIKATDRKKNDDIKFFSISKSGYFPKIQPLFERDYFKEYTNEQKTVILYLTGDYLLESIYPNRNNSTIKTYLSIKNYDELHDLINNSEYKIELNEHLISFKNNLLNS